MNLFAGANPQRVFAAGNQAVNFHNFVYDNKKADGLDQAQMSIQYDNGEWWFLAMHVYTRHPGRISGLW